MNPTTLAAERPERARLIRCAAPAALASLYAAGVWALFPSPGLCLAVWVSTFVTSMLLVSACALSASDEGLQAQS